MLHFRCPLVNAASMFVCISCLVVLVPLSLPVVLPPAPSPLVRLCPLFDVAFNCASNWLWKGLCFYKKSRVKKLNRMLYRDEKTKPSDIMVVKIETFRTIREENCQLRSVRKPSDAKWILTRLSFYKSVNSQEIVTSVSLALISINLLILNLLNF